VSVGGPIWRNHTFFFFSYEGLRQHQGVLQNSNVFSAAQQAAFAANAAAEPIAAAIAALVPAANSGTSNYVAFTPGPVQIDQYTGDIFQTISPKDSLHGFYAFQKDVRTEPALQGDTVPGFGDHRAAHRQIGTLSETHIFSSSLVNEARFGFNRIAIAFNPANTISPTSVGLVDGLTGNVGIPQISFSDIGLTIGGPSGFPQGRDDTTGVLSDTLTKLYGKHTIKVGGEFRRYLVASFAANIGSITFTNSSTSVAANNFAADNTTVFSIQPNTVSSRVYADAAGGFFQDNYKLTPTVTLEAGLRFEWNGTPVEGANRFTLFNPANATLTQVGTNGLSANAAYNQNYNFEPRIGVAVDVFGTGKTVIRGGYGYLVDQPVSGVVTGLASNPPFSTAVSYNSATPIPLNNLYNSAKASGIALSWVNPKFSNAYVEDFNLNIQQAIPGGIIGSIGYYGSVGRHLYIQTNANQVVGTTTANQVHPYTTLSATSPIDPGGAIASNIAEKNSIGYSNYNALWLVASKNMNHGLEFNVNYEWTKSMDINSLGSQGGYVLPDSNNPGGNYGLSDFDVRQHFAGTAIYTLPFKRNRLVSGYQLSTIMQYQTGNPVNILASSSGFNGITGLVRPNLLTHVARAKQQLAGVTNVTLFQNPGGLAYGGDVCDITNYTPACVYQVVGTQASATATTAPTVYTGLGNESRNKGVGPGFADLDLSGEKDTKIFEGLTFKLRVDAFDILNHPNFGQPSGNVQSSTFGQITATRFATSDGGSSRQLQISGKFIF
jgi:hypothetical protein